MASYPQSIGDTVDSQEVRAAAVESAARLMGVPQFRTALIDSLPPEADQFRYLVGHIVDFINTGHWVINTWGINSTRAYAEQEGIDE